LLIRWVPQIHKNTQMSMNIPLRTLWVPLKEQWVMW